MADIKTTVSNESIASCTLPEGPLETVEATLPTVVKIREVMTALRDPKNLIDVHKVAALTRVKWFHVAQIRDAMREKLTASAEPKTIEEK